MNTKTRGHLVAFSTIFLWSTTFVSTKVLLNDLSPIEILLFRFALAFVVLVIIYPGFRLFTEMREEILFSFIGASGVFLYYLLENIALQYTQATNVGIIISMAPILTAVIAHFTLENEKLHPGLLFGFFVAISGVMLLMLGNGRSAGLYFKGDAIAFAAAISFGVYSVLLSLIRSGHHYIFITQKTFFHGLLWMLAYLLITKEPINAPHISSLHVWLNLLFLSLVASGLCFVLWNYAVKTIGSVSASNYIYLVPLITALTAIAILDEKLTWNTVVGGGLILLGVFLAQNGLFVLGRLFRGKLHS